MIAPFDIFRVEDNGPIWRSHPESLQAAIAEVGAARPGTYMIVSLRMTNRVLLRVDYKGTVVELPPHKYRVA